MSMNRWLVVAGLMMGGITAGAQEKKAADEDKNANAGKPLLTEVSFAKDQVPVSVKAGVKVDLRMVTGQTVMGNGRMLVNSKVVVPSLEVVAVTKVDQPKEADEAIKVELKGTKEQIEKVNQYKGQKVRVVQRKPGGVTESKEVRVPLRLEPAETDQKKEAESKKSESKKADNKTGETKKSGSGVEKKGASPA